MNPLVSVVIPVLNGAGMIESALQSLIDSGLREMEVIVVDDASTDDTVSTVLAFGDERVRLVRHAQTRGTAAALNTGISVARGQFIARLDADDMELPGRLKRQLDFLVCNPDVVVVGMGRIIRSHVADTVHRPSVLGTDVGAWLVGGNFLVHPATMIRKAALDRVQGPYKEHLPVAQDYRLWVDLARHGKVANFGEPGIVYREHADQTSVTKARRQGLTSLLIRFQAVWILRKQLGLRQTGAFIRGLSIDLRRTVGL